MAEPHGNASAEAEILARFWERNESAIETFLAYDGGRCYRIAFGITENAGDAEECINDLCLKLWNSIPPEHPDSLRAYACRLIRNIALNYIRKQNAQKRSAVFVELDECIGLAAQRTDSREIGRILDAFLAEQPRVCALIFMRRYYYSDSVKHIAEITGFRENKVSRILAGMRKKLRKRLLGGGISV